LPPWVEDSQGVGFRRVTAHFDGAREMDILTFQQHVLEAYQVVFRQGNWTLQPARES
jgi:hypothetical protein